MIQHIIILIFGNIYNKSKKFTCSECGREGTGLKGLDFKFVILYALLAVAGYFVHNTFLWALFPVVATIFHTMFSRPRCRGCYSKELIPYVEVETITDEK